MQPRREIKGSGVERIYDAADQPRNHLQDIACADASQKLLQRFRGHWTKIALKVLLIARWLHHDDDGDRNASGNKAVLDGGRARFIRREATN